MRRIVELAGLELEWTQPNALKMEYELRVKDEIAASLRFRSSFGTLATAESADGCWTFKRVGFWQTRVSIRACGSETEIAQFRNNTWEGGGTLEFPDGRKLRAATNFWMTKFDIQNEAGEPLLHYKVGGFVRLSAELQIEPRAAASPELPWIALLGWYLIVMMYMDSAAATAATTAI